MSSNQDRRTGRFKDTERETVKLLDTVIRYPDVGSMTEDARRIRVGLNNYMALAGVRPTQKEVVNLVVGKGWQPWPEDAHTSISRHDYRRSYKRALYRLADYLEEVEFLYEGMVVA